MIGEFLVRHGRTVRYVFAHGGVEVRFLGDGVPDQFRGQPVRELPPPGVVDRLQLDLREQILQLTVIGRELRDRIATGFHRDTAPLLGNRRPSGEGASTQTTHPRAQNRRHARGNRTVLTSSALRSPPSRTRIGLRAVARPCPAPGPDRGTPPPGTPSPSRPMPVRGAWRYVCRSPCGHGHFPTPAPRPGCEGRWVSRWPTPTRRSWSCWLWPPAGSVGADPTEWRCQQWATASSALGLVSANGRAGTPGPGGCPIARGGTGCRRRRRAAAPRR